MGRELDLYVFSHIPKTAGFVFRHNIELSNKRAFVLRTCFAYKVNYFNQHTRKTEYFQGKEDFIGYVNSLSQSQKDKIHCLAGHNSYYGVHELLNRAAHYSTFIREPIDRVVSLYNYERNKWEIYNQEPKIPLPQRIEHTRRLNEHFAINGQAPDFETWLEQGYNKKHIFYLTMTDYLQYLNFIDEKRDETSIQEALNKFDFVGITATFNEDAAYLYHAFQVYTSTGEKNISPQFVKKDDLSPHLIQKIRDINQADILLYECALRKNSTFKKNTKDFYIKVAETKQRCRRHYPIEWTKMTLKNILRPIVKPVLTSLNLRK